MKKSLIILAKVLISAALFGLSYVGFTHGSSAGCELGVGMGLCGLIHWCFWG